MGFEGDDRAVTVQIGAVLLLGFVVVALSMYQATVVPQENERVEFRHSQAVVGDMQEVRSAVLGTAATGTSTPATVELGRQYPARSVFVNPSPPGGTLSTSSLGTVEIRNAVADDAATAGEDYAETGDFWDNRTRDYSTAALSYRPSYNRYQNAPTTVYENGIVYNRFGSGAAANDVTVTDQSVVSGNRISLVALSGNVSRGGVGTLSVDPRAVSQSTRTVSVSNGSGGPVSVVLPTRLSAAAWNETLADAGELDEFGGHVRAVESARGGDAVRLVFEAGETYRLRLSEVRVGPGGTAPEAEYLTTVGDTATDVELRPNESETFVVEARDGYNNPVAASLNDSVDAGNRSGPVAEEPGRYRYVYTAPDEPGDYAVGVGLESQSSTGFDPRDADDVRFEVTVTEAGGGGSEGDGSGDNGGDDRRLSLVDGSATTLESGETSGVQFTLTNGASDDVEIVGFSVDSTSESSVQQVHEQRRGSGSAQHEAFFDAGSDSQYDPTEADGRYESRDEYHIGTAVSLTDSAVVAGDDEVTVYLFEFRNRGGNARNMVDEAVTVTVEYADGESETFTFTASNPY